MKSAARSITTFARTPEVIDPQPEKPTLAEEFRKKHKANKKKLKSILEEETKPQVKKQPVVESVLTVQSPQENDDYVLLVETLEKSRKEK